MAAQVLVLAGIVALPLLRPRRGTPRGLRVAGTALVLAAGKRGSPADGVAGDGQGEPVTGEL